MDMTWAELSPVGHATIVTSIGLILGLLASLLFRLVLTPWTRKTRTDLDDRLIVLFRPAISLSIAAVGAWYGLLMLELQESAIFLVRGVVLTGVVIVWTSTASRATSTVLDWLVENHTGSALVTRRTVPAFDFAAKVFIYGGAVYFVFLSWKVDLTGWFASAGVVGIAVGFAAQDTLANLIAGVFILADAPYRVGDYLILDSGERGFVTDIGVRATRLTTVDDIQIILPNAVMAGAKIVNESGGPRQQRVACEVGVAYGSDVDRIREILRKAATGIDGVVADRGPVVRFVSMGDSALIFKVLVWVERPPLVDAVRDALNTAVYKALVAADVEIPYPKQDVYLYQAGTAE